jgi:hypothetical protein
MVLVISALFVMQAGRQVKKRKKFKIQKSKKDSNPKIQNYTLVYIYKRQSVRLKSKSKIIFLWSVRPPSLDLRF